MNVTIEINGLYVRANHGVMAQERVVGNDFEVDLQLVYPSDEAVGSDRLDATLNYADVVDEVKRVMAEPSALLEHVAGRIRRALMSRFPRIESGMVRVAKLSPPIAGAKLRSVAVALSW